jgi:pilus assembly protein Flp/PilA
LVNSVSLTGKPDRLPWEQEGAGKADREPRASELSQIPSHEGAEEMKDLFTKVRTFILDEEGASAVEYGLLVAGIAVAVMAAIYGIGTALNTKYGQVQTQLGGS